MKRVILSCLSAVSLFACPGPTPEADAGQVDAGRDAGTTVVDAGIDAGTAVDAGVDAGPACDPGDAVLGTLTLATGARVLNSSTMPAGVTQAVVINDTAYGLKGENIIPMGLLFGLQERPAVASINTGTAGSGFPSAFLAADGTKILAGYTTAGAGAPGTLTLLDIVDNSVVRIPSNGNYDAVGVPGSGFIVSAISVSDQSDAGVYTYNTAALPLIGFPAGSSSGNVARTGSGMLVYGYADSAFAPHVLAVPPDQLSAPFLAAAGVEVYAGTESVTDVATANDDVFLLQNAFDSSFNPANPKIVKYHLTNNLGVISVGAPAPLLSSSNTCTEILFVSSNGSSVLVGLKDEAHATRLLEIQP